MPKPHLDKIATNIYNHVIYFINRAFSSSPYALRHRRDCRISAVVTHWRRNVYTVLLAGVGMLCKEQAIMAVGEWSFHAEPLFANPQEKVCLPSRRRSQPMLR